MNYLKASIKNTWDFLSNSRAYFRDVLLMHGLILFVIIPFLGSSTKFILKRGQIDYLSFDNLSSIVTDHPVVALLLGLTLLFILLVIFFEFTFLLLSVYFIEKKEPVSLRQLLRMTVIQLKKIRPSVFLFFLFYFFLILPIGGLSFNSNLTAKIKIPAFIMDFIFANRVLIIGAYLVIYLLLIYVGIRVIFALPEMILRDRPFRQAVKESLAITKRRFLAIVGRFIFIGGSILLLTIVGFLLVLGAQLLVETFLPEQALISAVFAMTLLQFFLLLNVVLSTVGIFYIIIDFMQDEGFLPAIPTWFYREPLRKKNHRGLQDTLLISVAILFGVGVSIYNMTYLTNDQTKTPVTISHRGVNDENAVQNTLTALEKTSKNEKPDYIEMDVQLTKDHQFIVLHDWDLRSLADRNERPAELTLNQLTKIPIHEHGMTDHLATFDAYLAKANQLDQKLLVEIKTQQKDTDTLVDLFLKKYQRNLVANGHMIQSLSYPVVEAVKKQAPDIMTGYILPFNIVGPPITSADFLTMEYSTINRDFIESAQTDHKKVFVWTPNDADAMDRMLFYGVDGIITDQMAILNQTIKDQHDHNTYSDKLLNFVIGVG